MFIRVHCNDKGSLNIFDPSQEAKTLSILWYKDIEIYLYLHTSENNFVCLHITAGTSEILVLTVGTEAKI